jgi:hypothetical protein
VLAPRSHPLRAPQPPQARGNRPILGLPHRTRPLHPGVRIPEVGMRTWQSFVVGGVLFLGSLVVLMIIN